MKHLRDFELGYTKQNIVLIHIDCMEVMLTKYDRQLDEVIELAMNHTCTEKEKNE